MILNNANRWPKKNQYSNIKLKIESLALVFCLRNIHFDVFAIGHWEESLNCTSNVIIIWISRVPYLSMLIKYKWFKRMHVGTHEEYLNGMFLHINPEILGFSPNIEIWKKNSLRLINMLHNGACKCLLNTYFNIFYIMIFGKKWGKWNCNTNTAFKWISNLNYFLKY